MGGQLSSPLPTTNTHIFPLPITQRQRTSPARALYRLMSSQPQSHLGPCICAGTQACPSTVVDRNLMDTSDWTAQEWDAALILTDALRARNAAKEDREMHGTRPTHTQGPIRGMCKGPVAPHSTRQPHNSQLRC